MAEFEVSGISYKSRRMSAMDEERVTRKLAPLLNVAVPALKAIREKGDAIDLSKIDSAAMVETMTRAISELRDDSAYDIIGSCLSVCERQQGEGWVKIWSTTAKRPLFDDIRAPQMYLISAKVLEEAIRDFMAALGLSFSAEGLAPTSHQPASQTA